VGKFQKGERRPANAGRKPGSPNRTTRVVKDAFLEAARRTGDPENGGRGGLVGYLMWIARKHPVPFASQLGRLIPESVKVEVRTEINFRSVADIDRELASLGFPIEEIAPLLLEAPLLSDDAGSDTAQSQRQPEDDESGAPIAEQSSDNEGSES
jgi:hypothetical protein